MDGGGRFPSTRWSLILSSREAPERASPVLEELLGAYWSPLYLFLRRRGLARDRAEDAVQGFMLHLLERDFLERLDPGKGRFRSYLLGSLRNWLADRHDRESAAKRGGGALTASLDFDVAENQLAAAPGDPEAAFDAEWAWGITGRTLDRLRAEFESGSRRGPLAVALKFFGFTEAPSYAEGAGEAGMSEAGFKSFLHRTRLRFRAILREEVADTVAGEEEIDAEIDHLLAALRAARG